MNKRLLKTKKEDREYCQHELYALFLSWLYCLPGPVFNPATPQGLSGRLRHASEWSKVAHLAGLNAAKYLQTSSETGNLSYRNSGRLVPSQTPTRTIFVVQSNVVSKDVPPEVVNGCRRIAELTQTPLLGVDFVVSPNDLWIFAGASPYHNLMLGQEPLLDALAEAFQKKGGWHR